MNSLAKRTISGIVFVAIMLAGLLLNRFLFAGLVVFVMVAMMLEFYKMTMGDKYKVSRMLAILAGSTTWWFSVTLLASTFHNKFNIRGLWILNKITGSLIFVIALVSLILTLTGNSLTHTI